MGGLWVSSARRGVKKTATHPGGARHGPFTRRTGRSSSRWSQAAKTQLLAEGAGARRRADRCCHHPTGNIGAALRTGKCITRHRGQQNYNFEGRNVADRLFVSRLGYDYLTCAQRGPVGESRARPSRGRSIAPGMRVATAGFGRLTARHDAMKQWQPARKKQEREVLQARPDRAQRRSEWRRRRFPPTARVKSR